MKAGVKKYFVASSVMVGSCIGAGVLGIPYVAAQAGLLATLLYILLVGGMIYLVNLYLGEVVLRTKGDHQLIGYTEKYLGRKARHVMEFAVIFGVYAAIIAYMVGMGQSLSQIFTGTIDNYIYFGVGVGILMSTLLRGGMKSLKKFEKIGVFIILGLLMVIVGLFSSKIVIENLTLFNWTNIMLPFGVVLFALMSFHSVPEIKIIMKRNEHRFKKVLKTGTIVSMSFYILFTFVVVGFKGMETPQVATLALGTIFVFLGIFTMFTSYLASGNALRESFQFDERMKKNTAWALASFVPIGLFLLTQLTDFFSFTKLLSIGGVVSGGTIAVMVLLMVKRAKRHCNRKTEYEVPAPWWAIGTLILIFVAGVVRELLI
jgi:amino acid permease